MNNSVNTFGKDEKLCSELDIEALYKGGKSFLNFPIVFYYLPVLDLKRSKVLVSVSKKKFKRAVDRNLLKRRIREAYRLNKSIIKNQFHLGFVYIGSEILTYQQIEKSIKLGLDKIDLPIEKP